MSEPPRANDPKAALQLLQLVMDNIPQHIFWKDREGRYLGCNGNFARIAGKKGPEELIGLTDFDMPWTREEAEYFVSVDRRVMQSRTPEYHIIEPQKQADGKQAWLETNKVPLLDENGNVMGILGTFEDITERRATAEALHHQNRLESLGQLAGGIAHDFNNLLAGIFGASELLQRRLADGPEQKLLAEILRTAKRASDLTSKLLAFSRKGAFSRTAFDFHETIEDVLSLVRRGISASIEVESDLSASHSVVEGDISELELAVLNLCLNARDAMPEGGKLRLSTRNVWSPSDRLGQPGNEERLLLEVADTGSGISPDILGRIFDPFFTTKPPGAGTGLGLSAVYGAVKAHGGSVWVESTTQSGSTFIVELPVSYATAQKRTSFDKPAGGFSGGRVLVIDDEASVRLILTGHLEELGFEVVTAGDGHEGLTLFERDPAGFELVVLDAVMPRLSGKECLAGLRMIRDDVRVILCSGFLREQAVQDLSPNRPLEFLKKPFSRAALERALSNVLQTQ
ncbi:MAG TPA: ATP-binding protein [Polyangiaceae bacterium]|nr:ATP-binding protein [Polyangiaceae bacterium]